MKKWPLLVMGALIAAPFVHAPIAQADSEEPCYVFVFDAPGGPGTNPETLIAQVPCGDPDDLYAQVQMIARVEYKDDCRRLQVDTVSQASAKAAGGPNEWGRWMQLKIGEVATPDLAGAVTWDEHVPRDDCEGVVPPNTTTTGLPVETSTTLAPTTTSTSAPPDETSTTLDEPTTTTTEPTTTTTGDTSLEVFQPTPVTDDVAYPASTSSTLVSPSRPGSLALTGSPILVLIAIGVLLAAAGIAAKLGGLLGRRVERPKL